MTATALAAPTGRAATPSPIPMTSPTTPFSPMPMVQPTSTLPPTATLSPTPIPSPTSTRSPTPWPIPTGRGTCEEKKFRSATLSQDMMYFIYLPPAYNQSQAGRRYPTLFLLSGLGGNYKEWKDYGVCTFMDQSIPLGKVQPMIVVMPSGNDNPAGGIGSYWFNHAPNPPSDGKRWGDYVWKDLVAHVEANYRTLPRPASRAVGGLSAGGQGALTLALTHPDIFGVLGAHSASFRRADGSVPYFGDEAYYNQYDPIWLVQNTQHWTQLTIWMDYGDHDTQWGEAGAQFHELLLSLQIPHEWHIFYGTHDPPYWMTHTPDYLQWYSSKLIGQ